MPGAYELGREAGHKYREALLDELQNFADQVADSQGVSSFDVRVAAGGGGAGPQLASLGGGYGGGGGYGRGQGAGGVGRQAPSLSPDGGLERPEVRPPTDKLTPEPGPRGPDTDRFERPDEPSDAIPKPVDRPELPAPSESVREPGGTSMRPVQPPEEWQRAVEEEEPIVGAASTYDPTRPGWKSGGMQTASGERYDPEAYTAAIQQKLRGRFGGVGYGSRYKERWADVTDPSTGKTVRMKINDIMPYAKGNRVIDMSHASMLALDPTGRKGVLGNMVVRPLPPAPPGTYQGGPTDGVARSVPLDERKTAPAKATGGGGGVEELQAKEAKTRKGALSPDTRRWLEYAAAKTGLRAVVTSGGQRMPGARGATGSHRHDLGGSGDLHLIENGRTLDMRIPRDAARMEEFAKHAVRAGATGVGAGLGYMGRRKLHIGGGRPASWGGAGWIERARRAGMADRLTKEQVERELAASRGAERKRIDTLKTKPAELDIDKEAFSPERGMRKPREEKEAATPEKIAGKGDKTPRIQKGDRAKSGREEWETPVPESDGKKHELKEEEKRQEEDGAKKHGDEIIKKRDKGDS